MTSTTHQGECRAAPAVLSMSVDLSAREWLLTMGTRADGRRVRARVRPGDGAQLTQALELAKRRLGLPPDAPVRRCCEAGRERFWRPVWSGAIDG